MIIITLKRSYKYVIISGHVIVQDVIQSILHIVLYSPRAHRSKRLILVCSDEEDARLESNDPAYSLDLSLKNRLLQCKLHMSLRRLILNSQRPRKKPVKISAPNTIPRIAGTARLDPSPE